MEPHELVEYRVWKARQAARDKRHIEEEDAKEYKERKAQKVARNERYREAAKYKSLKGTQITRYMKNTRSDEYHAWQAREISINKKDLTYREERKSDRYNSWWPREEEDRHMKERKADRYNSWWAREEEESYMKERKADRYDSWQAKEEEREERYMKERKADRYDSRRAKEEEREERYMKERKADRYDSWRDNEEEREERYTKERKADRYNLWRARKVEREVRYKGEKPDRFRKRLEANQMLGLQNKRVNNYMMQEEHWRKGARSPERSNEELETENHMLTWEQREQIRFQNLQRKKDFVCLERIDDRIVNILEGLELHTGVFSAKEQMCIVDFVYELQNKGRRKELGEYTYSRPKKWMRSKGRETIQFGSCYNYAAKNGNLPGILQNVVADPLPHLFKVMIKRMVRWHVLPSSCVPDSCIVNIYDPEDCIPPHIDSHDFVRPFCTVSFLSECDIVFGSEIKIAAPGEFIGSFAVPLPVGSVLVLNGNGADVAKHCVPAVRTKRISITFRKMDERKRPIDFVPEADLQNIQPLAYDTCIEEIQKKAVQKKAVNDKSLD